jgi:uncharacterized membrane protein YeaQ/YmgE (transglycosylase-associated protein family)
MQYSEQYSECLDFAVALQAEFPANRSSQRRLGHLPISPGRQNSMEEQIGFGMGIFVGLLIMAVFGAIAGWIASKLINGTGLGLGKDILLGIVGAVVGGWLFQLAGVSLGGSIIGAFIPPIVGAVIVLLVVKAVKKA